MIQIPLLLVKLLGIRRMAGWVLRLIQVVFVLGLAGLYVFLWSWNDTTRTIALWITGLGLLVALVWAIATYRPKKKAEVGERTIDGKVVPELLAAAALGVPAQSPDGDSVLRGLPDYGKMLLKLDSAEFEYRPEVVPDTLPELPEPEPEEIRPWFAGVPRWAWVSGVAALLIVVVVGMTQGRERHPVRNVGLNDYLAAHAATTEAPQESAPAPLPPPASVPAPVPVAEAAPAPAIETQTEAPKAESPSNTPATIDAASLHALRRVSPVYPASAAAAHIEGAVVLEALISETGKVEDLYVKSGPKELQKAAMVAVKQWTYSPFTTTDGKPTEVDTTITVNFQLAPR